MISTEAQYWIVVGLLVLCACLHFRRYAWFLWVRFVLTPRDPPVCLCKRIIAWSVLMIIPFFVFGIFAYSVPARLLRNGKYCPGNTTTSTQNCQDAEDAGSAPMMLVYFPTVLMWIFDSCGCLGMWVLHVRDQVFPFRHPSLSDVFVRVMFPRFGLTMIYASLIFYAGILQLRLEGDDSPTKLAYAHRLRVNGWVSFSIGLAFWICAACAVYLQGPLLYTNQSELPVVDRHQDCPCSSDESNDNQGNDDDDGIETSATSQETADELARY
mmetsp:Transcript_25279/g.41982  ORF Transcript_25279/g.41982 Transcript_25279/m.41982 type:complete len:269 (+) Transcript_25279:98-904(+)